MYGDASRVDEVRLTIDDVNFDLLSCFALCASRPSNHLELQTSQTNVVFALGMIQ